MANLTDTQRNQLERLGEAFAAQKRNGQQPSIQDYADRYPELAEEIQEFFPVIEMLERAVEPSQNLLSQSGIIGPGTQLGEYKLIRQIGRGGMGVVFDAEHSMLGSKVAIKLLPATGQPKMRERFLREASAAARMHHPNIVRVHDFGSYICPDSGDETLYFVMTLVEGWGLDKVIGNLNADGTSSDIPISSHLRRAATNKVNTTTELVFSEPAETPGEFDFVESASKFGNESTFVSSSRPFLGDDSKLKSFSDSFTQKDTLWSWVARIGVQVADALDHAHSMGIVHRDVKPSNLMIDENNLVFVMDFGLAKVADENSLTGTGDVLGTLRYMPPESIVGRADHRSDIYGLGLTLYELIANRPAFESNERGALISRITNGNIEPIQKIVPKVPRDLATIIHKAIDVDPTRRYPTSADMRDDLNRMLKGEPVKARRSTLTYHTLRWISRNQVLAGSFAFAIFSLALGLSLTSWGWSKALTAEKRASRAALNEKEARVFAEKETSAKEVALKTEESERKYAQAIAQFVKEDLLQLTTVQGQLRAVKADTGKHGGKILGKDATLRQLLDRAAIKLRSRDDLAPEIEAELCAIIGLSYRQNGFYDDAEPLFRRAIEIQNELHGPTDARTLRAQNSLVVCFLEDRNLTEAKQLLEVTIKNSSDTFREDDPFMVSLMTNLATLFVEDGSMDQAIVLAEQTLEFSKLRLGNEHETTIDCMQTLAMLLCRSREFERGIELLEETLRVQQKVFGEEHSKTFRTRFNLGVSYSQSKQIEKAIGVHEEALPLMQATLGKSSNAALATMAGLASAYHEAGDSAKALPLMEEALRIRIESKGEQEIGTLRTMAALAVTYADLGRAEEAVELLERSLGLARMKFDEDHPEVLMHMDRLANSLSYAEKFDSSIELFESTLALSEKRLGVSHPSTLVTMDRLAIVYEKVGDTEKAIELLRKSHERRLKKFGDENKETKIAKAAFLAAKSIKLEGNNEFDQAAQCLVEAIRIQESVSPDNWHVSHYQSMLGAVLVSQKKFDEARSFLALGFDGLVDRRRKIKADANFRINQAIDRLIVLANAESNQDDLKRWEKAKEDLKANR